MGSGEAREDGVKRNTRSCYLFWGVLRSLDFTTTISYGRINSLLGLPQYKRKMLNIHLYWGKYVHEIPSLGAPRLFSKRTQTKKKTMDPTSSQSFNCRNAGEHQVLIRIIKTNPFDPASTTSKSRICLWNNAGHTLLRQSSILIW